MSRLLNNLRVFPSSRRTVPVSHDMKLDNDWWVTFLPLFNGVSLTKPDVWSFDNFQFATDACLTGGGATCQDQCFSIVFPLNIVKEAVHITALELFVVVVVVRAWAPLFAHHQFIVSCDNDAFGTIQNHISSLKHFHQFYGFRSGWEQHYSFQLIIKGLKRYLGMQSNRKQAITPLFLHHMAFFFDLCIPLHAAMWALFLVAFFSFLRKSNLVIENTRNVSSAKVLRNVRLLFLCRLFLAPYCVPSQPCIHISI